MGSFVLTGFARQFNSLSLPKAGYHYRPDFHCCLLGAGSVHDATALNETRTLSFHHTHSDEDLTVTFKRDGRYDEEALKQLNHFLRDWRSQDQTTMDRRLFDILWEVYRDVDGKKPIQIISSYRSPATNAMLRRRSSGVARFSQHMLGHAMDFYIPGVPLEQIRAAGLRLQRGGVGFYPTSGSPFVHLDTGSIRHWPRMTHDQLARVFPDGRTVHIPSDGNPLKGYELARADIEKRGDGDDAATRQANRACSPRCSGASRTTRMTRSAAPAGKREARLGQPVAAVAPARQIRRAGADAARQAAVAATFQLASADAQIVPAPKAEAAAPSRRAADKAEPKPQTPADIINARGFWDDAPAAAEAGNSRAGRRPQGPPGARRRRSASRPPASPTCQQGAGLRAGIRLPGRPRQRRRRLRADPAQRPPGAATLAPAPPPRSTRSSPRDARSRAA